MIHYRKTHTIPNSKISKCKLNYNSALCDIQGKLYLVSRSQNSLRKPSNLSISYLSHNLQVMDSKSIDIDCEALGIYSSEDPRVVVRGDELYIFFQSGHSPKFKDNRVNDYTLHVAHLDKDFNMKYIKPLIYQERNKVEKNWSMFFDTEKMKWMCLYSVNPWVILEFNENWEAKKVYENDYNIDWAWGEVRGGASPILVLPPDGVFSRSLPKKTYYTFFHSSYQHPVKSLNILRQYVGGLLTFSADFPYLPMGISRLPILTPKPTDKTVVCANVCFPAGAVHRDGKWLISYGSGDCQCKIEEFNHEELQSNLAFYKGNY